MTVETNAKPSISARYSIASLPTAIFAVLLLAVFPLVGNALAFPDLFPRRLAQFAVLIGALLFYRKLLFPQWARILVRSISARRLAIICAVSALVVFGPALVRLVFTAHAPDFATFLEIPFTLLWIVFGTAVVLASKKERVLSASDTATASRTRRSTFFIVTALGIFLAFKAWWYGPPDGQALVTLGGSEIIIAVCASVGFFSLLALFPAVPALLAGIPYAYLILYSTSRTGIILFPLMNLVVALSKLFRPDAGWGKRLVSFLATLLLPTVLILGIFFPMNFEHHLYPFRTNPTDQVLIEFRVEEFYNRAARGIRAIEATGVAKIPPRLKSRLREFMKFLVKSRSVTGRPGIEAEERVRRMLSLSRVREQRLDLLAKTWAMVRAKPLGYWPVAFSEMYQGDCSVGKICAYPHNFFLEMGFYFGWAALVAAVLLLGYLCYVMFRSLCLSFSTIQIMLAVSILVHLVAMQLTGSVQDHVVPLLLVAIWLIESNEISEARVA